MKRSILFLIVLILQALAYSLDYSLATDYCFVHKKDRVFIDGYFTANSSAAIDKHGFKGSNLRYTEGAGAIFINAYPAKDHAFSFEFGYSYMKLDFDDNPSFSQKHFHDGIFSIGYITTAIRDWRWVINLGVHANFDHFNIEANAFYTGMIWGRLGYSQPLGIHIGVVGQSGVKSTYLFPILGFDWHFLKQWKINAIFPLDFSLHYYFTKNWSSALSYRSFGGWYRSFHRVGKRENNPESMFSVHANGIDLGIYFDSLHFSIGLFGGANFGGWILIRNRHGAKPIYYHFDYAGYAGGKACLEF